MPARIYPGVQITPDTDLSGYTPISLLYNLQLNWAFEVSNADSANQIFAYMPAVIATALGINRM